MRLPGPTRPHSGESGPSSATANSPRQATSVSTELSRQAVLGRATKAVVWLRKSLILVTPETVVRWHRGGFRLYWAWLSRPPRTAGRKALSREVRELIFRMVAENSRWVKRAQKNPDPVRRWLTFLRNHREAIAAMDFFTVPTLTFGILYCFFVIDHNRRKVLHFNVTRNPNAPWVVLQLRQTRGYDQPQRFLIFDRDAKFNADVVATVEDYGIRPIRTAFRSPWQNGVAERWVGSVRRDLLDHVIVLKQRLSPQRVVSAVLR